MNIYETDKLLAEYLLFHYGTAAEIAPPAGAEHALDYPVRCAAGCAGGRALDVGCAVGRAAFELGRTCDHVIGIDSSRRFIEAAEIIRREGSLAYERVDEGAIRTPLTAKRPPVDPERIRFEVGDAMALRADLGEFDVVLAANLIDRLSDPARFLERLPSLVRPGGRLVLTSPYTWIEEFTPRDRWLGGYERDGMRVPTLGGLRAALEGAFHLVDVKDMPFLIREHARKFQLSVAQATIWIRDHAD